MATKDPNTVNEQTTPLYSFNLAEGTTAILSSYLSAITLTLYDLSGTSQAIINSRNAQDVNNTNNVTITSAGRVTWVMQQADTTIQDTANTEEDRMALFRWTYNTGTGGTKYGSHEFRFKVKNLAKVT